MSSRSLSRVVRPAARQLVQTARPAAQRRALVSLATARASAVPTARFAVSLHGSQQARGVKTIDFAGSREDVYGEDEPRTLQLGLCSLDSVARMFEQLTPPNHLQSVTTGPRPSSW